MCKAGGSSLGVRTKALIYALCIAAGVGSLAGCDAPNDSPDARDRIDLLLRVRPDSGIELRTAPLTDTVTAGDGVRLLYVVVNGIRPTVFVNNPDWFRFEVEAQGRGVIQPVTAGSITRTWGDLVRLALPANATLVQVVDLECVAPRYGTRIASHCDYSYNLQQAGTYRIVTTYEQPAAGEVVVRLVDTTEVVVLSSGERR